MLKFLLVHVSNNALIFTGNPLSSLGRLMSLGGQVLSLLGHPPVLRALDWKEEGRVGL